eukprot:COSAG06_NODE_65203_length_257_cov_1.297468_1_plen_32_part_01
MMRFPAAAAASLAVGGEAALAAAPRQSETDAA